MVLGGLITLAVSYLTIRLVPGQMSRLMTTLGDHFSDVSAKTLDVAASIGFLSLGAIGLGLSSTYIILGPSSVVGYGLGIAIGAFFLRLGAGVYKAASDISEDSINVLDPKMGPLDSRNPATFLDMSGELIGQMIGYGTDLLSSLVFAVIGASLARVAGVPTDILPALSLLIFGVGLLSTVAGYLFSRTRVYFRPDNALLEGIYLASILSGAVLVAVVSMTQISVPIILPYLAGIVGAVLIGFSSEYVTTPKFAPTRRILAEIEYGPVVAVLNAISYGFRGGGIYGIYLLIIVGVAFFGGGIYGMVLAAMGMLSVSGSIWVARLVSPVANLLSKWTRLVNAGSASEQQTARLQDLAYTTVALGNGFASGAAVFGTGALFLSVVVWRSAEAVIPLVVDVTFLVGVGIGVAIPYLYLGYLTRGLARTVVGTFDEVTRQFREIPFLREGKSHPDMRAASDQTAWRAVHTLTVPGILAVLVPVATAVTLGPRALVGLVLGVLVTSVCQGYTWANVGDALEHARHAIASGAHGGRQSPNYEHVTVADNLGDCFKDLLSPSINTLIKSVSIVAALTILWLF